METLLQRVLKLASEIAKPFEGLHKVVVNASSNVVEAYHDPVGYPTIGFGHLLSKIAWEPLKKYPRMTFVECETQLQKDMVWASGRALSLSPLLGLEVNFYRWAAITDFIFNCGDGNYNISTLRKKINSGEWLLAVDEIKKWDKAGGKKLPGLTKRRFAESILLTKEL